jgi:hypothetical protein
LRLKFLQHPSLCSWDFIKLFCSLEALMRKEIATTLAIYPQKCGNHCWSLVGQKQFLLWLNLTQANWILYRLTYYFVGQVLRSCSGSGLGPKK